jgi:23S rRNA pseudouridine955/2504/2580 synthase
VIGVRIIEVAADEAPLRLDRWFRRHFPGLSHGRLEKLLRTGQVRVDGKRVKAGVRLEAGQQVRVPPIAQSEEATPRRSAPRAKVGEGDIAGIRERVLFRDDDLIVLDKPAGLAVQGGSGVRRHLDAMLEGLRYGLEDRPRLVHRLDRDTSGVLLLARTLRAATELGEAFRDHRIRKIYWALVAGIPAPRRGEVAVALGKAGSAGKERMREYAPSAKPALTRYAVRKTAGPGVAWLSLEPLTGRTHQLRAHCTTLGTPILNDGKYGGRAAYLDHIDASKRLHLHARSVLLPAGLLGAPRGRRFDAALPAHMAATWERLGFDPDASDEGPGARKGR